jgi:hypothetical protein
MYTLLPVFAQKSYPLTLLTPGNHKARNLARGRSVGRTLRPGVHICSLRAFLGLALLGSGVRPRAGNAAPLDRLLLTAGSLTALAHNILLVEFGPEQRDRAQFRISPEDQPTPEQSFMSALSAKVEPPLSVSR